MTPPVLEGFEEELLPLVQELEKRLLELEDVPGAESVAALFRTTHTLKAAAAMLGFEEVTGAADRMENVLDAVRSGARRLEQATLHDLLGAVDALRGLLRGAPTEAGRAALAALDAPASPAGAPAPAPPRRLRLSLALQEDALTRGMDPLVLLATAAELGTVEAAAVDASRLPPLEALDPERLHLGFQLTLSTSATAAELRAFLAFAESAGTVGVEELAAPERPEAPREAPPAPATLVVGAARVDALVTLGAELLLATSRVEQLRAEGAAPTDVRLESACREALRLATQVQEAAMAMRLAPLEPTFLRIRHFVRVEAAKLGKQVQVELRGGQTELDRSVAERLLGALEHLARNALDHGIAPPEERVGRGKSPQGRLVLSAREERGRVVLEVEDDGRGIDPSRVAAAAAARGLLPPDARLTSEEAVQLILQPGFSTAERVGALSGRGVGLDVVRRNLLAVGGELRVRSQLGKGTRFTLSVPLTMAVLDGLVVSIDGERRVVPRDAVERLVPLELAQLIRLPDGRAVLQLPDGGVPLLRPHATQAPLPRRGVAVIVGTSRGRVAIPADEVLSQESVLLKPLPHGLKMAEGVLGAAVLGDGRVALVLDLTALVEPSGAAAALPPPSVGPSPAPAEAPTSSSPDFKVTTT